MHEGGADVEARQWRRLAGGRNPVVWQPKVIQDSLDRLVIRPNRIRLVMGFALLGVAVIAVGVVIVNGVGWWWQLLGVGGFAVLMGLLGLVLVLEAGRVVVDPATKQLTIRGGYWPWPRLGVFSLADVRPRLRRREMPRQTHLEQLA